MLLRPMRILVLMIVLVLNDIIFHEMFIIVQGFMTISEKFLIVLEFMNILKLIIIDSNVLVLNSCSSNIVNKI